MSLVAEADEDGWEQAFLHLGHPGAEFFVALEETTLYEGAGEGEEGRPRDYFADPDERWPTLLSNAPGLGVVVGATRNGASFVK